jgi:hypothetical protein
MPGGRAFCWRQGLPRCRPHGGRPRTRAAISPGHKAHNQMVTKGPACSRPRLPGHRRVHRHPQTLQQPTQRRTTRLQPSAQQHQSRSRTRHRPTWSTGRSSTPAGAFSVSRKWGEAFGLWS